MLSWMMSRRSSRLCSRRGIAAVLLFGIVSGLILAQDNFVAIPPQEASRYHIDFAGNFFATPEAEKADRANLYATVKELETLKGKVAGSPDNLQRALQLSDRVRVQLSRQFYLEQFLEGKGTAMFYVAPEVAVEHAVYDGVRQGTIKGADDLDVLTKRIYSRYSIWPEKHDELKAEWMKLGLMYEDPFYYINYIYGTLLALKFYEIYTRDPEYFVPRYIALMRNGFDAPPEVLLKRFLEIDLHDTRLVSTALSVVEDKINLLEKGYRK